jgi:hypothetical protein
LGGVEKFSRYVVLEELGEVGLSFNLDRVRDEEDRYQPGIDPDPVNGVFRGSPVPVNLDALVRDR